MADQAIICAAPTTIPQNPLTANSAIKGLVTIRSATFISNHKPRQVPKNHPTNITIKNVQGWRIIRRKMNHSDTTIGIVMASAAIAIALDVIFPLAIWGSVVSAKSSPTYANSQQRACPTIQLRRKVDRLEAFNYVFVPCAWEASHQDSLCANFLFRVIGSVL